jgi:preprotein translocase subunit SecF
MQIFKDPHYNFIGTRKTMFIISGVLILAGIVSLVLKNGPKYGIDFAGGTIVQLRFDRDLSTEEVRTALRSVNLEKSEIQKFRGTREFLFRTEIIPDVQSASELLIQGLKGSYPDLEIEIRREEKVGPKIGEELRTKALKAILISLVGIIIYMSWRFEFKFSIAAIIALIHDVMITITMFSLFNKEINLPIVAALLTIVGYSLNDTIVVFDRIREDLKLFRKDTYANILNLSINQCLGRTVNTSLTTLLVILALYFFGGKVIHDFAFALLIGVAVGTYSSIFIASPVLLEWNNIAESHKRKKGKIKA